MPRTNTLVRSLHDGGLAAWFGGSLMGAIGLNGGAATAVDKTDRTKIASAGWAKWVPVNAAAIAAHAVGGIGLIANNKKRLAGQSGVAAATAVKSALTLAAIGTTAYAGVLGRRIADNSPAPVAGVTEASSATPDALATAQQQQKYMQWATPVLTGAVIVMASRMGEQQRATSVLSGVGSRIHNRLA